MIQMGIYLISLLLLAAPFPSPPSFSSTTPSSSPTEETEEPSTTENPRDKDLREFFNDADTDHDGQLSYQEFVVHLAAKINLSQGQTQKLMNLTSFRENFLSVDANGDNQLSFEEFRNLARMFSLLFEFIFHS
jgi:Ca2+-binding EF-hand superfamily protein